MDAAWRELNRSKIGRKARISGQSVHVAETYQSQNRMMRDTRRELRKSNIFED